MSSDVTTTHGGYGDGHPVLVLAVGEHGWSGERQPVFALDHEVTTIGSAPGSDIRLTGLAPLHARIVHDERDDYVLALLAPGEAPAATDDDPAGTPGPQPLRAGSTFRIGGCALTFLRAESADHGRPSGGRAGGEGEGHPSQGRRPDYRREHDEAVRREGRD